MTYHDKNGKHIEAGMYLKMEDGSIELIHATTDTYGNLDLGVNASNEDYLRRHPEANQEFYSLCNFNTSKTEILEPISCLVLKPGEPAEVVSTVLPYTLFGDKRTSCNGHICDDGTFNIYYGANAEEENEPYNCTYDDIDYYGMVVFSGMYEYDISLTDAEIEHLRTQLQR